MTEQKKRERRPTGRCEECGQWRPLNAIYAPYAADVMLRLCDECRDKRAAALEAMYRGE